MKKFWENPANATVAPQGAHVPDSLQIGNVRIAPATILAPMAGVTDTVFRRFIRNASFVRPPGEIMSAPDDATEMSQEQIGLGAKKSTQAVLQNNEISGCGLLMTEFTSADGLFRTRESKRKRYLTFYEDEHPISAQLFGSDPYTLAESAKIVEDAGFDLVDLNLGCPAKRVVKCNGGSGLLKDLPVIGTIFEAVRAAVKIPFTVKFRLGWDDENIVCVSLAKMAEDSGLNGVAAVTLLARAGVQRDRAEPTGLSHLGKFDADDVVVVPTGAEFYGEGNLHGRTHRFENLADHRKVAQQARSAVALDYFFRRATEVEIDQVKAQVFDQARRFAKHPGVAAEKLRRHGMLVFVEMQVASADALVTQYAVSGGEFGHDQAASAKVFDEATENGVSHACHRGKHGGRGDGHAPDPETPGKNAITRCAALC